MSDDTPVFGAYQLTLLSEMSSLALEDDLPEGPIVDTLRELSRRLSDLADYYEQVGTADLFD